MCYNNMFIFYTEIIMIKIIGTIGAIGLAVCAAPQALECFRTKSSAGLSHTFLLLWTLGEIFTLIYVLATTADPILLLNYCFNLLCLLVILWFKYFHKHKN